MKRERSGEGDRNGEKERETQGEGDGLRSGNQIEREIGPNLATLETETVSVDS